MKTTARDTRLDRDIAIKVLPPEVADDPSHRSPFEREAKSVAALGHDKIVTIHTIGEESGIHYLAMALVEGETLDCRIPENGLPTDTLVGLAPWCSEIRALPDECLGKTRVADGEIRPARNCDPGVAVAPVHGTAYPQVEAWFEAATRPQVEEQERPLETWAQAGRREHPE